MKDENITKEQLIHELAELRHRVGELEESEAEHKRGKDLFSNHFRINKEDRIASELNNTLTTVIVPQSFHSIFLSAQDYVERYFQYKKEDPQQGTIEISGERYILVRAASMSTEFFDLVVSLYKDRGEKEARTVAFSFLFDLAHAIGKADAKSFYSRMGVNKPIEKLSAGPIHFAYTGWAFVEIFTASNPTPDDNYYLIYDHPFSFEADTWLKSREKTDFPVCIMNAGYSSGWCEESFGIPLVAAEIECRAKGDEHCRFIMSPPSKIEKYISQYSTRSYKKSVDFGTIDVPEFFQRKRLEDELLESDETVRALLNTPNDRALLLDSEGNILALNETAARAFGMSVDKLIGLNAFDLFPAPLAKHRKAYHDQVVRSGKPIRYEDKRNGRWMDTTVDPVHNSHGKVARVAVVSRDMMDYKQMQEALRKEKEFNATLIKTSPALFVAIAADGRIILMNEAMLKDLGYTHDEVIGKNYLTAFVPKADRANLRKIFQNISDDGTPTVNESRMVSKDGQELLVEWHGRHILKKNREVDYFFALGIDVTERKRAEDELRRHHDHLEDMVKERTNKLTRAMEDLRKREAELKTQSRTLEEANIALKVVLKQMEEKKREDKENILSNVKQLVIPYLHRLKKRHLDPDQMILVNTLEANLNNITSPLIGKLSSNFLNLTPMEIHIAHLVKEGLMNKEIAELLGTSLNTVSSHRYRIRSKLGLKNKGANLRSYLLSLEK
jgi:PAS domain S-box-containing protein